eukprot:2378731-Pleurochrysis_carterae.AAC.2
MDGVFQHSKGAQKASLAARIVVAAIVLVKVRWSVAASRVLGGRKALAVARCCGAVTVRSALVSHGREWRSRRVWRLIARVDAKVGRSDKKARCFGGRYEADKRCQHEAGSSQTGAMRNVSQRGSVSRAAHSRQASL